MNARGFTLVEALVAFAILALTLTALYGALGTSLAGIARSTKNDEAVLIASSKLAELAVLRALPSAAEGAVEGTDFRWRVEPIAEAQPEGPEYAGTPLRTQRLKLTIRWRENGTTRSIAVERRLLVWRGSGG
ncbi:MAG: prepilin-type N-terminal cleavage/methylation domain-containing protein [Alphaproteobacteria bacterium]|nr:prepilin-type N-terminal cleavage/methylation domain-containing protein [Alphaproteobacteria bacterium]